MIVKQEGEEEREAHKDQSRWERKHWSNFGGIYEFIPVNHIWDIGTLCYNKIEKELLYQKFGLFPD